MKVADAAWLAGLFEGEGSVHCRAIGNSTRLQLTLEMTDEDVVKRFAETIGVGKFSGPRKRVRPDGSEKKPLWTWRVCGYEGAQAAVAYMWPWLGERRSARCAEALRLSNERWTGRYARTKGGELPHGTRGRYNQGCRCDLCRTSNRHSSRARAGS